MKRVEVSFDIDKVPLTIRQYLKNAIIYDSSCSENAKTLYVKGMVRAFLKSARRRKCNNVIGNPIKKSKNHLSNILL